MQEKKGKENEIKIQVNLSADLMLDTLEEENYSSSAAAAPVETKQNSNIMMITT